MPRPEIKYVEPQLLRDYGWQCQGKCTSCNGRIAYRWTHPNYPGYFINHLLMYATYEIKKEASLLHQGIRSSKLETHLFEIQNQYNNEKASNKSIEEDISTNGKKSRDTEKDVPGTKEPIQEKNS